MKKNILRGLLTIATLFMLGCASSYTAINPPAISHSQQTESDEFTLAYKYDVLKEKGNRKYSFRETTNNIKVISISITNNTDSRIHVGKDLVFFVGGKETTPLTPNYVAKIVRQRGWVYLCYLALSPIKLFVTNFEKNETTAYPIGYVIGPGIASINMAKAYSANLEFNEELHEFNIMNAVIDKGETVYGLVSFKNTMYQPISVKLREQK